MAWWGLSADLTADRWTAVMTRADGWAGVLEPEIDRIAPWTSADEPGQPDDGTGDVAPVLASLAERGRQVQGSAPAGLAVAHPLAWDEQELNGLRHAVTRVFGDIPVSLIPAPAAVASEVTASARLPRWSRIALATVTATKVEAVLLMAVGAGDNGSANCQILAQPVGEPRSDHVAEQIPRLLDTLFAANSIGLTDLAGIHVWAPGVRDPDLDDALHQRFGDQVQVSAATHLAAFGAAHGLDTASVPIDERPSEQARIPTVPITGFGQLEEPETTASRGISRRTVMRSGAVLGSALVLGGAAFALKAFRGWHTNQTPAEDNDNSRTIAKELSNPDAVAFNPDSGTVAVADYSTVLIVDLANDGIVQRLEHRFDVVALAYAGPTRLMTASGKAAYLWDLDRGVAIHEYLIDGATAADPDIKGLAVHRGERIIACAVGKDVHIWDMTTGDTVKKLTGAENPILSVAISADGKRVAVGEDYTGARIWSLDSGQIERVFPIEGYVQSVAFSPDGQYLATAGKSQAQLWDATNGQSIRTFTKDGTAVLSEPVAEIAFSPDGTVLLTTSEEDSSAPVAADPKRSLRVWDVEQGSVISHLVGHDGRAGRVGFNGTGTAAVTSSTDDQTVRVWPLKPGEKIRGPE